MAPAHSCIGPVVLALLTSQCHGALRGPAGLKTLPAAAFLNSVAEALELPAGTYTASGTHFAQGYTTKEATDISVAGMQADCDNINLNMKLSASFRSDVFGPGLKGFFNKCEKVGNKNKYTFTVAASSSDVISKLCNESTVYPIVYDSQHFTYWRDEPFSCLNDTTLLGSVAESMGLPAKAYTVSGTHFAQGYTAENATDINVAGMQGDCDNINLNMKLSPSFRSDVFGEDRLKGFFHKCEKVGNRNKYWFTITSENQSDISMLCNSSVVYPIVHDRQHDTYWRDEPFTCEGV